MIVGEHVPPNHQLMIYTIIKKLVYGDGGLPRYMGSHAIQQSVYGLNILDNNLNIYSSIGTPFFQNNDGFID